MTRTPVQRRTAEATDEFITAISGSSRVVPQGHLAQLARLVRLNKDAGNIEEAARLRRALMFQIRAVEVLLEAAGQDRTGLYENLANDLTLISGA